MKNNNEFYKKVCCEEKSLFRILTDPENLDPVMVEVDGVEVPCEQIAVIPDKKRAQFYCILKPLVYVEGIADDEALVCYLDCAEDGAMYMHIEEDFNICTEIFEEYYKMLDKADVE